MWIGMLFTSNASTIVGIASRGMICFENVFFLCSEVCGPVFNFAEKKEMYFLTFEQNTVFSVCCVCEFKSVCSFTCRNGYPNSECLQVRCSIRSLLCGLAWLVHLLLHHICMRSYEMYINECTVCGRCIRILTPSLASCSLLEMCSVCAQLGRSTRICCARPAHSAVKTGASRTQTARNACAPPTMWAPAVICPRLSSP